ncbi:MAG: heavy metal-associated domain-containing protein, partial [Candidatus Aminicenantales bacterium]
MDKKRGEGRAAVRIDLAVTGMSCAGCAANVEKAIKELEGVREASVNLATAKATVLVDPGLVSRADLVRAIRNAGYGVAASAEAAGAGADKEYRSLRTSVIWGGALALIIFLG